MCGLISNGKEKKLLQVNKLNSQIILFESLDFIDVQLAFFRLTEYYEGEETTIKNKVFKNLEDLMIAYAKKGSPTKTFSFFGDWAGFNVPGHKVREFFKKHKPLTESEKIVHKATKNVKGKFYIIGSCFASFGVITHEIAHGLYQTNKSYKEVCLKEMKKIPNICKKIQKVLGTWGYKNSEVLADETQAYLGTESLLSLIDTFKLTGKEVLDIVPLVRHVGSHVSKILKKSDVYGVQGYYGRDRD